MYSLHTRREQKRFPAQSCVETRLIHYHFRCSPSLSARACDLISANQFDQVSDSSMNGRRRLKHNCIYLVRALVESTSWRYFDRRRVEKEAGKGRQSFSLKKNCLRWLWMKKAPASVADTTRVYFAKHKSWLKARSQAINRLAIFKAQWVASSALEVSLHTREVFT